MGVVVVVGVEIDAVVVIVVVPVVAADVRRPRGGVARARRLPRRVRRAARARAPRQPLHDLQPRHVAHVRRVRRSPRPAPARGRGARDDARKRHRELHHGRHGERGDHAVRRRVRRESVFVARRRPPTRAHHLDARGDSNLRPVGERDVAAARDGARRRNLARRRAVHHRAHPRSGVLRVEHMRAGVHAVATADQAERRRRRRRRRLARPRERRVHARARARVRRRRARDVVEQRRRVDDQRGVPRAVPFAAARRRRRRRRNSRNSRNTRKKRNPGRGRGRGPERIAPTRATRDVDRLERSRRLLRLARVPEARAPGRAHDGRVVGVRGEHPHRRLPPEPGAKRRGGEHLPGHERARVHDPRRVQRRGGGARG
mmetsp:Transcript_3150/g.10531  ORF Transcript_3150/g.10531 Transcript_3150/m.10531 type:complete len:373 (-) Transcript_3150:489-1607(-)